MKHRTRYLLALTLIATTLCAGQLFASDQAPRIESKAATEKLVARLTRGLSRTVAHSPLVIQRQTIAPIVQPIVKVSTTRAYCISPSPLRSNLPPPLT